MINNMSDEFLDWLDKCPVQWFLNKYDEDDGYIYAEYGFKEEKKQNE